MYEDTYEYNYQDTLESLGRIITGRHRLKDYKL